MARRPTKRRGTARRPRAAERPRSAARLRAAERLRRAARSAEVAFDKMVGAGNDFLIVDARRAVAPAVRRAWSRIASAMCDRRYGIGADGLLVLEPSRRADARMRVFNADGSEAEMCGNGARCVVRYIGRSRASRQSRAGRNGRTRASGNGRVGHRGAQQVQLETKAGILTAALAGERVRLRMSTPSDVQPLRTIQLDGRSIDMGFVNTGVPHVVVSVPSVEAVDVGGLGRRIRQHETFAPRGANVNFVETLSPSRLRIRTYERGVEGETPACGTGVTAAAVIHAARQGGASGTRSIELDTRSGEVLTVHVTIEAAADGPRVTEAMLEGTAQWICQGRFAWPRRDPR